MSDHHSPSILPVVALLVAASLWGVFWYPLRWLEQQGVHGLWAAYWIYAATLLVALPSLWRGRAAVVRHPGTLLVIALANGWCNVSFFVAVIDGNILRVLLLFYLSPIWTVIIARLVLGERLSPAAWGHFGLALIGAVVMLWEPGLGWPWPQSEADWLALSSGVAFAFGNVAIRKVDKVAVSVKTGVAWSGCFILAALWIAWAGLPAPVVEPKVVLGALALGLFGMVIMTSCVLYGVSRLPAHRSAVIMLFELVVGAVSQQWLTDELVLPREWMGGALILLAAWLSARRS